MPLEIELAPGEKLLVNGALFVASERRARLVILSEGVALLRGEMILEESEVTTPLRKLHYALQRAYAGTQSERERGFFEFGKHMAEARTSEDADLLSLLDAVDDEIMTGHLYEALRMLYEFRCDAEKQG